MKMHCSSQGWQAVDPLTGWKIEFDCSAQVSAGSHPYKSSWSPWEIIASTEEGLKARCDCDDAVQEIEIQLYPEIQAFQLQHRIVNPTAAPVRVNSIRTVDGVLEAPKSLAKPAYLHSLNAREYGLPSLCPLTKEAPSVRLGGVTYPFFEGVALRDAADGPCVVTGPLTQRIVHRSQQLVWDGDRRIQLRTEQELRGIACKSIDPGQTLELDRVFVQVRADGDPNDVFSDYLRALHAVNGARWEKNPLRQSQFYAPWNNYLYWEATEKELLGAARRVKQHFPSVTWFGVDDGYQVSPSTVTLTRRSDGELDYDLDNELDWYNRCPGVVFAFDGALGEDRQKFPHGLIWLSNQFREMGLRPELWLGMEVSRHTPLAEQHPEWFHVKANGDHLLLDVSVPEVRERIEQVFATYYGAGRYEAIKLDFYSRLFEDADLKFRYPDKTAAEWRQWFFEMIRTYLPDDGFISLGCDLAAGAPFLAEWVDSYRHSMDMRDGDWDNVKRNVRWSMVPLLTHGFAQPIADADSLSLFKGLSRTEMVCWADFAYVSGSLIELGGSPIRWDEDGVALLRRYLDHPCAGERVWFGDAECWMGDALPRVIYREEATAKNRSFLVSLHNWGDEPLTLCPVDWVGPIRGCGRYEDLCLDNPEAGTLAGSTFLLAPRSSRLLRVAHD